MSPIHDGSLAALQQTVEKRVLDRSTFVRLDDVGPLLARITAELSGLAVAKDAASDIAVDLPDQLDESLFLVSLVYLAAGKTQEAPAAYAQMAIIERLASHLKEASLVACSDLTSIDDTIRALDQIVTRTGPAYGPDLAALLDQKRRRAQGLVDQLRRFVEQLAGDQSLIYDRLIQIVRSLAACNTRKHFPDTEVKAFVRELETIGRTLAEAGIEMDEWIEMDEPDALADKIDQLSLTERPGQDRPSPSSHDLIRTLFIRTVCCARLVAEKAGVVEPGFDDRFRRLVQIRDHLEKMIVAKSWSVRETDLFPFMKQLVQIDGDRRDGRFVTDDGVPASVYTQRTLLYLVRKAYALIYQLLVTSEPVSEPLLPIYNQLTTLKHCLQELQDDGGVSSGRELYPFTLKLKSLDNTRTHGQFVVNQQIPDGQGPVQRLYDDCIALIRDLWPPMAAAVDD